MVIEATIVEIIDGSKLLMLKAARGVSKGKWNGPGGKLEKGETPLQCATREVFEETGLTIKNPFYHGVINFHMDGNNEIAWIGYIFSAKEFSGRLTESPEGKLKWFDYPELPWDEMWSDDRYWLQHVIDGKRFEADFYYDKENKNVIRHTLKVK